MKQYYSKWQAILLAVILGFFAINTMAQDMKTYEGHWEALVPDDRAFSLPVTIHTIGPTEAILTISGNGATAKVITRKFPYAIGQWFKILLDSGLVFEGIIGNQPKEIRIMMHSGIWRYHFVLRPENRSDLYCGVWNILLTEQFRSKFYLSVENGNQDQYEAYSFLTDHRFSGFACYDFYKCKDSLHFADIRTGLAFSGKLLPGSIGLTIRMGPLFLTQIILHPSTQEWQLDKMQPGQPYHYKHPADLQDGIITGDMHDAGFKDAALRSMTDSINAGVITQTQSILISRKGRLVYEQYFDGFDGTVPHDMRSASKSISSALIGIAMDQGILKDTGQKLFDLLPAPYRDAAKDDPLKQQISIADLLTMSSGLDAIDFGITRRSVASEDNYQPTADWIKTVVEAPMINQPGSHANYSSANPFLLGVVLAAQLKQPLQYFIDDNLFAPLGIDTYILNDDCRGIPYFGGGMHLRPRDMLKFGLLYAQQGNWNGQHVLSQKWIQASFKKYRVLENHPEKNEYGFLWWHYAYKVGNRTIATIEARGAGGQYIFIIPQYEMVVVVTSANFHNGRVWQPEKILGNYILPALDPS